MRSIAIDSTPEQPWTATRDLSPAAKTCAAWFRQMARALKTCRLYRGGNPLVQSVRESVVDTLLPLVRTHGGWPLRFRPDEILLGDEIVVNGGPRSDAVASPETRLPFLFYRDGIRGMHVQPDLTREEAAELFDALVTGLNERLRTDDLVTLLWQANLMHVVIEAAPLEQAFFLSDDAAAGQEARPRGAGPQLEGGVTGSEIRADLGQAAGVQGLHVDTFDDWPLLAGAANVREAFERLDRDAEGLRRGVQQRWAAEQAGEWDAPVPELFAALVAVDPTPDMRAALATASASCITSLVEQHQLARAARATQLLETLDPAHALAADVLRRGLQEIDAGELSDYLDEADPAEHGRFAALMVRLGAVAVPLTYGVMARATRSRVRAAAATALCYQCAEDPELLGAHLDEPRAEAMLNLVFVLGQIGGAGVVPMLRTATRHADPRIRRQAVLSLGGVPGPERTPALLDELARLDPHILSTTLGMLARQRDENVTRFILSLIKDPEFEARGEDVQRALFGALTEVADDTVVSTLDKILNRGAGWLGRRTYAQFAAALTLRRIASPAAQHVLEAGLKSKNATVRGACTDALNARAA